MPDDDETIDIAGVPVRIAPMEECAKADYIVCGYADWPNPFLDNVHGTCGLCQRAIIWRPYMPDGPMKVCVECFQSVVHPQ
jgi:hypothetical protein